MTIGTVYSFDVDCVGVGLVFQNKLLQEEEGLLVVSLHYKRYIHVYRTGLQS